MLQTMARPAEVTRERRGERRFRVFLPATLRNGADASRVQLRDLSCSGAMAEALRPPAVGSRVTLVREPLLAQARVAWVSGLRFGLTFDEPLRATDLLLQLSCSRAALPRA